MQNQSFENITLANTLNFGFYSTPASVAKLEELKDFEKNRKSALDDIRGDSPEDLLTRAELEEDQNEQTVYQNGAFASMFMLETAMPKKPKTREEKNDEKAARAEARLKKQQEAQARAAGNQQQGGNKPNKGAKPEQQQQAQQAGMNRQQRRAAERANQEEVSQFGPAPNGGRFTMGGQEVTGDVVKAAIAQGSESTKAFRSLYDKVVIMLRTQKEMSINARRGLPVEEAQIIIDQGIANKIMSSTVREQYANTVEAIYQTLDMEKLSDLHDMIVNTYGKAMNVK